MSRDATISSELQGSARRLFLQKTLPNSMRFFPSEVTSLKDPTHPPVFAFSQFRPDSGFIDDYTLILEDYTPGCVMLRTGSDSEKTSQLVIERFSHQVFARRLSQQVQFVWTESAIFWDCTSASDAFGIPLYLLPPVLVILGLGRRELSVEALSAVEAWTQNNVLGPSVSPLSLRVPLSNTIKVKGEVLLAICMSVPSSRGIPSRLSGELLRFLAITASDRSDWNGRPIVRRHVGRELFDELVEKEARVSVGEFSYLHASPHSPLSGSNIAVCRLRRRFRRERRSLPSVCKAFQLDLSKQVGVVDAVPPCTIPSNGVQPKFLAALGPTSLECLQSFRMYIV
ncbi:hypothetical protein BCR39DRAFT_562396 [Naematelia encephala]|uniref:Uncharacterized protein n=1 Tax=Naematelia encephala TaxID=71784 RepID=A0A1Y2AJ75_9TREE|nr:hypothetical protein BCR39DRAFT_562396 [Naematelia encephala]